MEEVSRSMGDLMAWDPGREGEILTRSAGISHGSPAGGGLAHMPASMLRPSRISEGTATLQPLPEDMVIL